MNLWIVTIGSSDVQLDSDKVSREKKRTEKQRSDKVWKDWYDDIKPDCYDISFVPKTAFPDIEETYRIPSRVLGTVYQKNSAEVQEEIWSYLTFPLLTNFSQRLKSLGGLGAIAYLLTDQSPIFESNEERRKPKSPYWDDTCQLEPILQRYFSQEFPGVKLIPLKLSPAEKPGLDDWDKGLALVKNELNTIQLDSEPDTVYVSHQAGTPAISSAVQFESLAQFGQRVKFLVSSEEDSRSTRFIDRSSYLTRIRIQKAMALLNNSDYSGVYELLKDDLERSNLPIAQEIIDKLDMTLLWNSAKFKEFLERRLKVSPENSDEWWHNNWWRPAYEAAYLATIRLEQGNTVEAFFHGFRAVEGLISKWAEQRFPDHTIPNDDSPLLKITILEVFDSYLGKKDQEKMLDDFKKKGTLVLSGFPLYSLLRADRPTWKKDCKDLSIFIDQIAPKRNKLFHRLKGLKADEVWQEWKVDSLEKWEIRILTYLNFISQQSFDSLANASLMRDVHEELEEAIASY